MGMEREGKDAVEKRRINIEILDGCADDGTALAAVLAVVKLGRISDASYCYATTFKQGIAVEARITRTGSDSFRIVSTEQRRG